MTSTRQAASRSTESEDAIVQAVMAMKQAVDVAIRHGDIRQDAVCFAFFMLHHVCVV